MLFSSFTFLFLFLPITLVGYSICPRGLKNLFLLVSSYVFYAWGAPSILPILVGMSIFDFAVAKLIAPSKNRSFRKFILWGGIFGNLSFLFYFKYWNFFLGELSLLLEKVGFESLIWTEVALPIGISFFTFQKLSYLIDVYRGTAEEARSLVDYLLYVALFPQLIAGPIVRYHEIADQLRDRTTSATDFSYGVTRFTLGLGKKVLIADFLGQVADKVFALGPGELNTPFAWLGILCYTFQIYFDFSGYSDMAIGLGRIFGFTFPENFCFPYISRSIQEFWTRWHMTLSHWMKEYLYIPLGGNRISVTRTALNLWIVFLLSGLWHGASWNFILWGAFHGALLSIERIFPTRREGIAKYFWIALTFALVMFSWVLFRADNLPQALFVFEHLFGLGTSPVKPVLAGDIIQARDWCMLSVAIFLSFYPLFRVRTRDSEIESWSGARFYFQQCVGLLVLLLSLSALAGLEYTPFLYFRF